MVETAQSWHPASRREHRLQLWIIAIEAWAVVSVRGPSIRPDSRQSHLFVRHRVGLERLGLFEVFAAISADDLVDFPAMAAHQRPAVVTAFAILMHLLRRYDERALVDFRLELRI